MDEQPLLAVESLTKTYRTRRFLLREPVVIRALDNVSLQLPSHSTLALVGRSGSGKSTLARCIARLEPVDQGRISFAGQNLLTLERRALKDIRRQLQIVFQHSATAINPRFTAIDALTEPLRIQHMGTPQEQRRLAHEWLERIGLPVAWSHRRSLEFSGGERQRLALARALILDPKLLILDEALSGLDSLTESEIVTLLLDLQRARGLAYLFITHNLRLAASLAAKIAVMHSGRILENADTRALFDQPQSAAARALIAAIPHSPSPPNEG